MTTGWQVSDESIGVADHAAIGGSVGSTSTTHHDPATVQAQGPIRPNTEAESRGTSVVPHPLPTAAAGPETSAARPSRLHDKFWLVQSLTDRDRAIVQTIQHLRLIASDQIERLHFHDLAPGGRSSVRRRVLARLVRWRVLAVAGRRVGGPRGGSGRLLYQPGPAVGGSTGPVSLARIMHALAVSDLYVDLIEHTRAHPDISLTAFTIEPECWQTYGNDQCLKPDATVTIRTSTYQDQWMIEVDLGTEHLPVITRKIDLYQQYYHYHEGAQMIAPVLFTTPTVARYTDISTLIARRVGDGGGLYHATTQALTAIYIAEQLYQP